MCLVGGVSFWGGAWSRYSAYADQFVADTGLSPTPSWFGPFVFDDVMLATKTIQYVSANPKASLYTAIRSQPFTGITGAVAFTPGSNDRIAQLPGVLVTKQVAPTTPV